MVKSCCVPGCTTGNALYVKQQKSSGLRNKSLFKPPKNAELFAKWVKAIPRKDKVLSESSYVCELHFEEDDVLIYDETILLDGTVNIIKRIRPLLKTGAVPCIFPNLPFNSTKHNNKRKPPTERFLYIGKNKSKLIPYLKENLNQLEKPDSKWMFELKDDEVELVRWNRGSSKKITISNDLIVKIFFSDIEILFDHIINTILLSMNETNELLKYIHSLIECKGIMTTENNITRRSITCKGYVEIRLGQRGPKSNYCFDCRVARKKMADSLRKKVLKLENKIQEK
ncbi:uncharacterized protein LOC100167836 isoform X2 [Acyrthosiphon pisum]|uniref:THAP-type domain-containing protein n=1 Tax=Acyrthosiphon pisum TaxID=7029 RepID=A0A8R2H310_ACYPI|nr:uncharacterized protein LOC100167836 isoform X2 [Acyrthosiphon pisum]|eukprot:XP_016657215.1 PREDICTED: uncharacterized protein LOC100167836 isoform X2 [Acyrthosiphon pisum]